MAVVVVVAIVVEVVVVVLPVDLLVLPFFADLDFPALFDREVFDTFP